MSGIVGRLFREFAMTLALAIFVSMAISLTTTPMMCGLFLKNVERKAKLPHALWSGRTELTAARLRFALDHSFLVLLTLFGAIALNVWLIVIIPKSFFPEQDTGRLYREPRRRPRHFL